MQHHPHPLPSLVGPRCCKHFCVADLIALLTIYNAAFAVLGVWLIDGGLPVMAEMPNLALFFKSVVLTACTGLVAAVLYQRALAIAPLSLTVPYLAFAPVFVVSHAITERNTVYDLAIGQQEAADRLHHTMLVTQEMVL